MRYLEMSEPGRVAIREKDKPRPARGEVLVRIKACGICSLEKRLYKGEVFMPFPMVPGHEASGVVEEVGEGVFSDFSMGDHVVLDLLHRCGECYFCRTGHSNQCENMFKPGMRVLGGMSEYLCCPSKQVFKIRKDVGFILSTLTEPLSDCIHSLMRTHLSPEKSVLIIGAGTMGLLHLGICKYYGVLTLVSEPSIERRDLAARLGADFLLGAEEDIRKALKEHAGLEGCDIVIVTAPSPGALREGLDSLRNLGTMVIFSSYPEGTAIELDPNHIHYKEITITGSESRTERDFLQAVTIQNSKDLTLKPLISSVLPLEEAPSAFEMALLPGSYRVVLALDDDVIEEWSGWSCADKEV